MTRYKVYTNEKGLVETDSFGNISELTWHRLDGPAYIMYNENGNIVNELYCVNNKRHRLNGPASIGYYENSNIKYETYWINDIRYGKDQYDKELLKLKVQAL
jgi:antitoxin component YwqK of YwqJK toxin-antitoxin module